MKFYNRGKELKLLRTLYRSSPAFLVLTGKRRVGKTELIKQFILSQKRSVYFFVDNNKSTSILLKEFERQVKDELKAPDYVQFDTFDSLFEYLFDQKRKIIVVFDEFQRFLKIDPSVLTALQKVWDLKGNDSKVFLILSGSSIGMMKKIFMESGAPLFKRADNILKLRPFSHNEIFEILNDLGIRKFEEKLNLYCVFGGTIYYYRMIEKYKVKGLDDALKKLLLNDLAPLKNEVRDIMIEEFGKKHATYFEILSALAMGKSTKKEMADNIHVAATSLSPYLYDLIDLLELVHYIIPVTEKSKKTKRGRYFLKDTFFRFYFKFIYKNMSDFILGRYERIWKVIKDNWLGHRGYIIEDIALDFIRWKMSDRYPHIGRHWDRSGTEIEIVGLNEKRNKLFAIEVKSKALGKRDVNRILSSLEKKITPLKHNILETRIGVIARRIEDKTGLKGSGFLCWDFKDIFKNGYE